jgi:acyl-CoA thioesterase FadM
MGSDQPPKRNQLAHSAYHSPYARSGAPSPHPNNDPYAPLRAKALATLEAMGYDPSTMVEHGVLWAEHQDPFGHVMHAQYMQFLGTCFHRVMESYSEHLDANEYAAMATGKSAIPAVRRYQLDIRRQVTYPDSLIAAYRQERIEPTRNNGVTCLFSLKQQAIVAEVKGSVTYMDLKAGRPVDIRALGGNWPALYEAFTRKSEEAQARKAKWDSTHGKKAKL